MTTPPQPPSETPTPRTDIEREGHPHGNCVSISFARQLEKELQEANQRHIEDTKLCGKHGCVSYKELEQLLVEKNITANTFMAQVKKLQAVEAQLTTELAQAKRDAELNAKDVIEVYDWLIGNKEFDLKTGLIDRGNLCRERIRDLVSKEGECGDLKAELASLGRTNGEMRSAITVSIKDIKSLQSGNGDAVDELFGRYIERLEKSISSTPTTQPSPTSSPSIPMDELAKVEKACVEWATAHRQLLESSIPRDVAEKMYEALVKLKPENECPFCLENEPCGHCMEMARVQGQVAQTLSLAEKHGLGKKQ